MKSSLLLAGLLLLASSAQAQHSHSPNLGGSAIGLGNNQGNWGYGYSYGSSTFGYSGRPVRYEDPRVFSVGYARNDGPFVPSIYMKYDDAVALGQQQLAAAAKAEQGDAVNSLGDVARSYRAGKVPTLRLESRVTQDNSGKLEICDLNGNNCHRP